MLCGRPRFLYELLGNDNNKKRTGGFGSLYAETPKTIAVVNYSLEIYVTGNTTGDRRTQLSRERCIDQLLGALYRLTLHDITFYALNHAFLTTFLIEL